MIIFSYLAILIAALYWVSKMLLPEMLKPRPLDFSQPDVSDERIEFLEKLLSEKNTNISLLQKEIRVLDVQVSAFDKIKTVLDEEIHRLREQNRIFRSELGLPAVQAKENSIT
jgi:hypothetical protein